MVLAAMILPAAVSASRPASFTAAMAAGGLALNATLQLAASASAGRLLPGSLVGACLMLPAALAVVWLIGRSAVLPAICGMLLSPLVLLASWHVAALLF
ncbi:MAG: hypothetical protein HC844_11500 [Tabrizicola sp.]|nr:hypothetical protein [Tabrizicola sp.]